MQTIKLFHEIWEIDTGRPLGPPGGFGQVFVGKGSNGEVAIKQLKVTASEAAHRELQIGQSLSERSLEHVIPILDYGQDAESDRYYIVMPVCDRSLQDHIDAKGSCSPIDCIEILLAILQGLREAKDITHRDIKPANILMHEATWKIADFGIAKFVEDSTSLETLRSSLTPAYAAPEQWLLRRPTSATDIYAVGCIAHALSTGVPPFIGDLDSLREQHLKGTPESLDKLPASVRSLVSQMLRKNPEIRPSLERCISVLERARNAKPASDSKADNRMSEAVSEVAAAHARDEAAREAKEEERRNRKAIFDEAAKEMRRIKDRLFGEIRSHALDVIDKISDDSILRIGKAKLAFYTSETSVGKGLKRSDSLDLGGDAGWGVHVRKSEWDIVAYTSIFVEQQVSHHFYTRCANIVFGRPSQDSDYRWYEMAFWSSSPRPRGPDVYPFCLDYPWEIDEALSNVLSVNNLAYAPTPIDAEDEDSFIEHWKDVVAKAMIGKLVKPSGMPMSR